MLQTGTGTPQKPFGGIPTTLDWLVVATMAGLQVKGKETQAAQMWEYQGDPTWTTIVPNTVVPSVVAVTVGDLTLFSFTGTTTWTQLLIDAVGSAQISLAGITGATLGYFANLAWYTYWPLLQDVAFGQPPGQRLVFVGHSLGGGMCQLVANIVKSVGLNVTGCYAMAAPRVGDLTFAADMDTLTYRLEATDDPVPAVPPASWVGVAWPFPIGGPPPSGSYTKVGTGFTLAADGTIAPGDSPVTLLQAAGYLSAGLPTQHSPPTYAMRLARTYQYKLWPSPADYGYASPKKVVQKAVADLGLKVSVFAGPPARQGGNVADVFMKWYMEYSDGSFGWSEKLYLLNQTNLRAAKTVAQPILKAYAQLLAVGVTIRYGYVSQEGVFRDRIYLDLPLAKVTGIGTTTKVPSGVFYYNDSAPAWGVPSEPEVSARVNIGSLDGTRWGRMFLRGLPNSFYATGTKEEFTPDPLWPPLFKAFVAACGCTTTGDQAVGTVIGVRGVDQTQPKEQISLVAYSSSTQQLTITCALANFDTAIDAVRVGLTVGTGININALWKNLLVVAPTEVTFHLANPGFTWAKNGYVQQWQQVVTPVVQMYYDPESYTSHDTGPGFKRHRGRSRNRPKVILE